MSVGVRLVKNMIFLREITHFGFSLFISHTILLWLFLVTGSAASRLGVVPKCTLKKAKDFTILNGRTYCFLRQSKMSQPEAISHCKALNSKLPLPKSNAEVQSFLIVLKRDGAKSVWIDLFYDEKNWKDSEGNKPHYVKLWVVFLLRFY